MEAALQRGSVATEEALALAIPDATTWEPEPVQKCTVGVAVCAVAAVAFHVAFGAVNYVAGANVALAINVWVWQNSLYWEGGDASKTQRQTEAYIYELSKTLYEG